MNDREIRRYDMFGRDLQNITRTATAIAQDEAGFADDRQAISDAQDAVQSDDGAGVQSTAAIGRLIRDGMKEVNYLDAIVRNKYARNADKIRAWESASHIERAPQRVKKPQTGGNTPPAAKPPVV